MLRNSDNLAAADIAASQLVAFTQDHPHHHSMPSNYGMNSYTIENSNTSFLAIKSKFDRSRPISNLRMSAGRILKPPSRNHVRVSKTSPWLSKELTTKPAHSDAAKDKRFEFSNQKDLISSLQHADPAGGSTTRISDALSARRPPKRKHSMPHHTNSGDMLAGATIRFDIDRTRFGIDRTSHICKPYVIEISPYLKRFTKSRTMKYNGLNTLNAAIPQNLDADGRPIETVKRPRYLSTVSLTKEGTDTSKRLFDHSLEEADRVHFPPTPNRSRSPSPQSFLQLKQITPPPSPHPDVTLWQVPLEKPSGFIAIKKIRTSTGNEHGNITSAEFVKEHRASTCASCHASLLKNKHTGKHLPALWPTGSELCKKCTSRYALHREHCPKCLYVPSALELRQNTKTCSACRASEWVHIPRD